MEKSSSEAPAYTIQSPYASETRSNILFAFVVALVLVLAYLMRDILLMLYVSVLFAVVLMPVIQGIMKLRIGNWRPSLGAAIVILLFLVGSAATLFFAVALPPVVRDLSAYTKQLQTNGPQLLGHLRNLPFASRLNIGALNAELQGMASGIAEHLLFSISGWATKIADIATVVVLTVYFMLDGDSAYRWALSLFPQDIRGRLDRTLRRAHVRMGKWLLGQGLLMLTLGVVSTIVFVLLKIRYAYALGVVEGVFNVIPIVGGLISILLVAVVAAIDSWGKVLGVVLFYVIYSQVESSLITPRIMKSRVNLSGLTILVALLMGAKLAGVVGAMVSVPTAVLVSVLVEEYLVKPDAVPEAESYSPRGLK